MVPPPRQPPDPRAQERALRLLETIEDLASDVLLAARDPGRSRAAEEAARLAADAEHAVLTKLRSNPKAVAATLVRIRRKIRTMAEDLANARRTTPPRPTTIA